MRPVMIAVALIALGCGAHSPATAPIDVPAGQVFELAIGQSARLSGPIATIAFIAVRNDSRCPVGPLTLCVSAGNAQVRLEVAQSGRADTLDLNTDVDPKERSVGTLLIRLTALSPVSTDGSPVPFAQYRASIVASGRAD